MRPVEHFKNNFRYVFTHTSNYPSDISQIKLRAI